MKASLYVLRQLSEVNFRDAGAGYEHYAVGFYSAYGDVLIFLAIESLEVLAKGD